MIQLKTQIRKKTFLCLAAFGLLLMYGMENESMNPANQQKQWVDSVMQTLTLRQRIAQLFMVAVNSDADDARFQKVKKMAASEQIGGVIAMRGNVRIWVSMINNLQSLSHVPLLTAIDGEYGVAMRFDSVEAFPRQMPLGALTDNTVIYDIGKAVAQQCRRLGIALNFAPVADVNSNPANPVINIRSFGENKDKVAEKSIAYMSGMQDGGILTCAKHFPGHGDTDRDSHHEIPVMYYSLERIDSLDLYPFKILIKAGVDAVMTGHLRIMAVDSLLPASLSPYVTGGLLRGTMNYDGLVFTDALNMRGISDNYPRVLLPLLALKAGSDVVLMSEEVTASIDLIMQAVKDSSLTEEFINAKCRKMLAAKYKAGLHDYTPVNPENLQADLHTIEYEVLKRRAAKASVTLLTNKNNLLPLQRIDTLHAAYLEVGKGYGAAFAAQLDRYAKTAHFSINIPARKDSLDTLFNRLSSYNLVIVGYHNTDARARFNFGVDSLLAGFLQRVCASKPVVFNFFGVPYALEKFGNLGAFQSVIVSYQNMPQQQQSAAQLIFGGIAPCAVLPVSVNDTFQAGYGLTWQEPLRLVDVLPEEINIPSSRLAAVDSLMQKAMDVHALPGGQILAAYKGQIFYHKSFGRHTYDTASPLVRLDDLYDVASLTKVAATLPVVMHLVSEGKLLLSAKLGDYLPLDGHIDKQALRLVDLLAHQSGLPAYEPFQTHFIKNGSIDKRYFSDMLSDTFPVPVARRLYASAKVPDYIYNKINTAALMSKKYRYSDWGFIYLQQLVEQITGSRLDKLADSLLYAPLGMYHTCFHPLDVTDSLHIVPTENDREFRRQLLRGDVHDPTAALLGGVSGHAGLFSTAGDLAKLFQLYLNKGAYGGQCYFDSLVIDTFTAYHFRNIGNRRGLGFDKPEPDTEKLSPTAREASLESYGHSGYTGSFVWVDPSRQLLYVFLSNRVYPDDGKKINKMNTRTRILSEFIKAVDEVHASKEIQ
ncbi:MAG: serine hydrolase [Prevotellaceae bacterium]|jgi:beta-glucosidase-like glycosyl hydrolase/CubicO group peptidase (beta-lactamase class C family)|nr:serine hydrolase [Prevotellaceae bacterium]